MSTECPQCGGALRFSLDDLARCKTVRCVSVHNVELQDKGHGAQRAYEDLERSIKRHDGKIG